jgi:hypothetical protein
MKQVIFTNWTFIRFLRLLIGIAILVQSFFMIDWLMGSMGMLFSAMALFNMGCCGVNGCATMPPKKYDNKKEITYEEMV